MKHCTIIDEEATSLSCGENMEDVAGGVVGDETTAVDLLPQTVIHAALVEIFYLI